MDPQCPADGTPLERIEVLGRSLQSCSQCGGTHLSSDDLSALTRLSTRALKLEPARTGSMVCPACGHKLCTATAMGQELDACPNCSGVWLGKGGLRRLMGTSRTVSSGAGAPRARLLVIGLAVCGVLVLGVFGAGRIRAGRLKSDAELAWRVRDVSGIQRQADEMADGEARKLALARIRYLQEDFLGCLNLLVGQDSDGARSLLKMAENGWMAQVVWPGRVLGSLAIDLDQDTDRELLRLTDPGFGDPGLDLSILSRRRRIYGPVTVESRHPNGKTLEKPGIPVALLELRSERITNHTDGLLFFKLKDGKFALDLVTAQEDKIVRYRFLSDSPVKVEDGKILTSEGKFTFQDDRFDKP